MRRTQCIVASCLVALIVSPLAAHATGLYTPGVGVRASAMGGAFVGLADDYSAVHHNPAGLYQVRGFQAVVSLHDGVPLASREGRIRFDGATGYSQPPRDAIEATSVTNHYFSPGVFVYADGGPLSAIADKIGLSAYTLVDYGVEWEGENLYDDLIGEYETLPDDPAGYRQVIGDAPDFESRVTGYVISPALSKRLSDKLSIGVSAHMLFATLDLTHGGWYEVSSSDSSKLYSYQSEESLSGSAFGATVGALYHVNEQISLGATLRTPMTVSLEGDIEVDSDLALLVSEKQDEDLELTFPLWVAGGLAYRDFLFDGLTMTADVEWTQWSEVSSLTRNLTTEIPPNVTLLTDLNWDDALGVHLGFDYRLSRSSSLMLGYWSEEGLTTPDNVSFVMPQIAHSGFSFGYQQRSDRWTLELALAYSVGESVEKSIPGGTNGDESQGKNLHDKIVPGVSFTYYF